MTKSTLLLLKEYGSWFTVVTNVDLEEKQKILQFVLRQDNPLPGQDSNPEPTEYEAEPFDSDIRFDIAVFVVTVFHKNKGLP
jgi:hypothetical protein